MQKELQQNEVYDIAKNISATENEEEKDEMLDSLAEVIAKHFEEDNSKPIEDAIKKALDESDLETSNIIMDEVYLEIESLCFEDDENIEFDSTMQLMPCTLVTDNNSVLIPSINSIESTIRKYFLEYNIIESPEQFRLGTALLIDEEVNNFKFQDWWNTHRQIIEEDNQEESESFKFRDQKLKVISETVVSLLYLIPIITNKGNNSEVVELIYNSYVDADLWGKISAELSSEDFEMTVFTPMGISETIQQSTYIVQDVEFDNFFDQYSEEEIVDIGYIQLSDDPDKYVVLFFDSEDDMINQFYNYGTQGDPASFVSMLVEKCLKNNNKTLFSFDEKIDMVTLNKWKESNEPVSIKKLLGKANIIDLHESYRMSTINSPISDPDMDNYSKKRTLH